MIVQVEADLRAGENVVHTTRVAVRRLRSTIRVFADLFDEAQAQQLDGELVWWAGMLGAVRDQDILAVRLADRLAKLPPEIGTVAFQVGFSLQAVAGQLITFGTIAQPMM